MSEFSILTRGESLHNLLPWGRGSAELQGLNEEFDTASGRGSPKSLPSSGAVTSDLPSRSKPVRPPGASPLLCPTTAFKGSHQAQLRPLRAVRRAFPAASGRMVLGEHFTADTAKRKAQGEVNQALRGTGGTGSQAQWLLGQAGWRYGILGPSAHSVT